MNERIRLLAEQAGLKVNADGEIGPAYFGSVDAGYRKFAELIVQECVQVSLKNSHRNDDMGAIIARQIRKHFGVNDE